MPNMPTKFGELWSTNGENGTVFQPAQNQLFRTLISQKAKGCCPLKISQLVKDDHWRTLANAYLIGHGPAPNNLKFETWPKIWRSLNYIVGVRWKNCTELFYVMCPHRVIKISASNFECLSLLKFRSRKTQLSILKRYTDSTGDKKTVHCLLRDCNHRSFRDVCSIFPFPKDAE